MVRRTGVTACIVFAIAAPASATESTIVPGLQIGAVKVGMTLTNVKKLLGAPATKNVDTQFHGHEYIEYGWNFSTFWVGFVHAKGKLRAALVGTDIKGQRTASGVGWGTSLTTLRARYRVVCNTYPNGQISNQTYYTDPGERIYNYCLLGQESAPTTIFGLACTAAPPGGLCTSWAINRVVVRTSF